MTLARKKELYRLFAANLEAIKKNPQFELKGNRTSGYICPLCFKIFGKSALSDEFVDQLTEEHVPPDSLGGSVKLLLCKPCNNNAGATLDADLFKAMNQKDFPDKIPRSYVKSRFLVNEKLYLGGAMIHNPNGFEFKINKKSSHHYHYDVFWGLKKSKPERINVQFKLVQKTRTVQVALFQIAYLHLYSSFGFSSLINPGMYKIRQQLQEHESELIKGLYSFDVDLKDFPEGISLVNETAELRSFAVTFKLQTGLSNRAYMVLLPGRSSPGLDIYRNIIELNKKSPKIDFQLTHLNADDIVPHEERTFWYHRFWQEVK